MKNYNFNECGENVTIYDPTTIINPELISLKNNIIISEYCFISGGLGTYIGNFIHISTYTCISGGGYCVLEDFVGLSAGCRIITGSEKVAGEGLTNPTIPKKYRAFYRSYVLCKKHSFLATNVIVHPGVTIGEGAVISSGSIVTKDVEPWSVYRGTPAIKIKDRKKDKILTFEKELLKESNIQMSDFSDVIKKVKLPKSISI